MNAFRFPHGGAIDRIKPLNFTFDGKPFSGFEGDKIGRASCRERVYHPV